MFEPDRTKVCPYCDNKNPCCVEDEARFNQMLMSCNVCNGEWFVYKIDHSAWYPNIDPRTVFLA